MFFLYKNAHVYSPKHEGMKEILVGNGKIVCVADSVDITSSSIDIVEEDLQGAIVTPGIIDQHVHITGGGGEAGFVSKVPELKMTDIVSTGTTTVVGVLGTDGYTRSVENLYAKAKGLEAEGLSTYMYTGSYQLPGMTLTGKVINDMIYIDKIIGLKFAISDHRGSFPTDEEIMKAFHQVRIGGMVSGKGGVVHMHLGDFDTRLDQIIRLVKDRQLPIHHFTPTHITRNESLFINSFDFMKLGGTIDITSGKDINYTDITKCFELLLKEGLPIEQVTISSDSGGSVPNFDESGKMLSFGVLDAKANLEIIKDLVNNKILPLEEVLKMFTTNVARSLNLTHKGRIQDGMDADLCIWDDQLNLQGVIAKGKTMVKEGKVVANNFFA